MNIRLGVLIFIFLGIMLIGACSPYIPVYPPTYTPSPWTPTPGYTPTFTPTPTTGPTPSTTPKWTFMVYIDGDNDLEPDAVGDLNEMEMVGSTPSVNIVVQIDRAPGYDTTNGDWTGTRRYYVTKDYDPYTINSTLVQDLGEINMGSPQSLIDFVRWAITNYPAEHYALIIWNHGGGFRKKSMYPLSRDIAIDETSNDQITMPELSFALSNIKSIIGRNIDLLGMDACLMAMVEVAYEVKNYANVMVASEENEPLEGWPYDKVLASLVSNPSMSPTSLGSEIVNNFIAYYQGTDNVTLSAIDLTKIGPLVNTVSNFASAVINDNVTPPSVFISDANSTEYYGDEDFIDLYDYADIVYYDPRVQTISVRNAAQGIMYTLKNAVIAVNSTYIRNNNGLSIYFPYNGPIDSKYPITKFAQDTYWDEMLQKLGF